MRALLQWVIFILLSAVLFLFFSTTSPAVLTCTQPYSIQSIQIEIDALCFERDVLENKFNVYGTLSDYERKRYLEILISIDALEELLQILKEEMSWQVIQKSIHGNRYQLPVEEVRLGVCAGKNRGLPEAPRGISTEKTAGNFGKHLKLSLTLSTG